MLRQMFFAHFFLISCAIAVAGPSSFYSVRQLAVPANTIQAQGSAINNRGDVAGGAILNDGRQVPVIWPAAGEPIVLWSIEGYATDINSAGVVTGHIAEGIGRNSFRWDAGVVTPLRDTRGFVVATRIDESGQVYGNVNNGGRDVTAAVEGADGMRLLAGVERTTSITGVNRAGVIVGKYHDGIQRGGFIAEPGGVMAPFDSRGLLDFVPLGINDGSFVVGNAIREIRRAAVFSPQFAGLLPIPDGFNRSYAGAINNRNQVIGGVREVNGFDVRPVLWDSPFEMPHDINELIDEPARWRISTLYDINDSGTIIGESVRNGRTSPVILQSATAVPLPPSAFAALTALPMFLGWKRFQKR